MTSKVNFFLHVSEETINFVFAKTILKAIIDVLKMDTEGAEWPCLADWVISGALNNVKQIAIEVHTPKLRAQHEVMTSEDHQKIAWIFEELERQGFRKYLVDISNGCCARFSDWSRTETRVFCCYELFYVNTNFLNKTVR